MSFEDDGVVYRSIGPGFDLEADFGVIEPRVPGASASGKGDFGRIRRAGRGGGGESQWQRRSSSSSTSHDSPSMTGRGKWCGSARPSAESPEHEPLPEDDDARRPAEPGEDDLDDLLRTWAKLRVENSQLQDQCEQASLGVRQMDLLNSSLAAALHGGAAGAGAGASAASGSGGSGSEGPSSPGTIEGPSAALLSSLATARVSLTPASLTVPELTAKRPRSFTSEVAAEPLHPHKHGSTTSPPALHSGQVSIEHLRELIHCERLTHARLIGQVEKNAAHLATLQKKHGELKEELRELQISFQRQLD